MKHRIGIAIGDAFPTVWLHPTRWLSTRAALWGQSLARCGQSRVSFLTFGLKLWLSRATQWTDGTAFKFARPVPAARQDQDLRNLRLVMKRHGNSINTLIASLMPSSCAQCLELHCILAGLHGAGAQLLTCCCRGRRCSLTWA